MKPAPPVTSSLRMSQNLQQASQVGTPVGGWATEGSPSGGLVQHAIWWTPGWARPVDSSNWIDLYHSLEEACSQRLLLDGDGEIIPARDTCIGPVEDAGQLRLFRGTPQRVGQRAGPRRS